VIAVDKDKSELIDGAMSLVVDRVGRSVHGLRGDSWRSALTCENDARSDTLINVIYTQTQDGVLGTVEQ
jgi:hypothetical protein